MVAKDLTDSPLQFCLLMSLFVLLLHPVDGDFTLRLLGTNGKIRVSMGRFCQSLAHPTSCLLPRTPRLVFCLFGGFFFSGPFFLEIFHFLGISN